MDIKFYRPHNPINSAKNRFKTTKSSDAKHKLPHFQTMKQPFKADLNITERDDYKNLQKKQIISLKKCGGWDLNPRRPTPRGPKPRSLDQAWKPPRLIFIFENFELRVF
jgi:hypothetical protein